jgi:phosphatidate cytidylyltransferase
MGKTCAAHRSLQTKSLQWIEMKNFLIRLTTALAGGAAVIFAVGFTQWGTIAFCSLMSVLGIIEFCKITHAGTKFINSVFIAFAIWIWFVMADRTFGWESIVTKDAALPEIILLGFSGWIPAITLSLIAILFSKQVRHPLHSISLTSFGFIYLLVPFFILFLLGTPAIIDAAKDVKGYKMVLGIMILNTVLDSCAYFGGKFFGRTKLIERISPKKTWEGTLAGFSCCIISGVILQYLWPVEWSWIAASVLTGIFSQFGDLAESLFKRSLNIKDTGSILPGHGGILDRFDGMLVSVPVLGLYYYITTS